MTLTDNALAQFKQLVEENENDGAGIRFFTVQGCCSPRLQMDVATSPKEGDVVVKMGEVDFFVTPDADKILSELRIDYNDGRFHSAKVHSN
jgi:Fe-S cluster assembly iron-binding protein IscA